MKIHLERFGNRIYMASNKRKDIKDLVSSIPGQGKETRRRAVTWAKRVNDDVATPAFVHTFPLTWRCCVDLRWTFSEDEIVIGPELDAWAWDENRRRMDLNTIRKSKDLPIPVLEEEYPRLAAAMHNRSYQAVGVNFLARAKYALLADDPGLGKTLQSAGAVIESRAVGPCLIIAPSAAAAITWPDEFDDWFPDEPYYVADGTKDVREQALDNFWNDVALHPTERTWLFCNNEMLQNDRVIRERWVADNSEWHDYEHDLVMNDAAHFTVGIEQGEITKFEMIAEMKVKWPHWTLRKESVNTGLPRFTDLFEREWSAVIVDEGHRFLPTNSSVPDKQSQTRAATQRLLIKEDGLRFVLTGTPMRGKPLNIWGSFHWLDPKQYGHYWNYVNRFWDVVESEFDGKDIYMAEGTAREYAEDLDAMMLRRTKAEVAPYLPPKVYAGTRLDPKDDESPVRVWLDMVPRQEKAYKQMVDEAVADFDSGQLMAAGVLAEMTRCKQMACSFGDVESVMKRAPGEDFMEWVNRFSPRLPSNKYDWTMEFFAERGILKPKEAWGEGKIIVASWQTALLNLFRAQCEKYKIPSLIITGEQSNVVRREAKATFQAPGGPRVFFLNTYAGGVSLTLDAADDMIVLDETYNPDDQTQIEDRIHRISRTDHQATYWYLASRGTIEEQIARSTDSADQIQRRLMDGRRGVEFAKQLLTGG